MSGNTLLRNLGYDTTSLTAYKEESPFLVDNVELVKIDPYRYQVLHGDHHWWIELKLRMSEADLQKLAHLVARLAPPFSVARLQADAHSAGTIFVGLVLCFEETTIPVNLVSGDIGCGLTLIPCMRKQDQTQVEHTDNQEYYSFVLACMRRSLKRGRVAEQGLTMTTYLQEAIQFYETEELDAWLAEMTYVLDTLGIAYGDSVLDYIGKFTQSLGSSGNHFIEMATDDHQKNWLVVHSGSRSLGSVVYNEIAAACRSVTGGYEVATGKLAEFYTRAYSAVNQFAKLNRVICAIAVLDDLRLETRASALKDGMKRSEIFASAIQACEDHGAMLGLLGGLTHNGIKAFVNDEEQKVMYVLSKGAIAIDRRSSSGIVALRAGEGCVVFTLVDPSCKWREMKLVDAVPLHYTPVFQADGVAECGHGAGRSQSNTKTEQASTFVDLQRYFDEQKVVANIAPGVLGDNPEKAYKPSSEILPLLPLDIAHTKSMLRTRVSHKEGLVFKKGLVADCAEFVKTYFNRTPLSPLIMDFNLVKDGIGEEVYAMGCQRRDEIMAELELKYRDADAEPNPKQVAI